MEQQLCVRGGGGGVLSIEAKRAESKVHLCG
jgi:hypothetical protein